MTLFECLKLMQQQTQKKYHLDEFADRLDRDYEIKVNSLIRRGMVGSQARVEATAFFIPKIEAILAETLKDLGRVKELQSQASPVTAEVKAEAPKAETAKARTTFDEMISSVSDSEDYSQAKGVIENSKNLTIPQKQDYLKQLESLHPEFSETAKEPWQHTKSEWSAKIKAEYGRQGFPDLAAKQATDATHRKEVETALRED